MKYGDLTKTLKENETSPKEILKESDDSAYEDFFNDWEQTLLKYWEDSSNGDLEKQVYKFEEKFNKMKEELGVEVLLQKMAEAGLASPMHNLNELYTELSDNLEDAPLSIDGRIFKTKEDAKQWLNEKTSEYGNTYFFPDKEKSILNQLITEFGNTYFW